MPVKQSAHLASCAKGWQDHSLTAVPHYTIANKCFNLLSRARQQAVSGLFRQPARGTIDARGVHSRPYIQFDKLRIVLRGRISRFSLDALVNIATALGCRVRFDLEAA